MKNNKNEKHIKNTLILNETMVKLMINNIISYAVRISNKNRIYKQIDVHCFNYLKKLFHPYLLTEFIPHENLSDSNNTKKDIYFNTSIKQKPNAWTFIPEPEASQIDRFSNRITYIKDNKNNNKDNNNNNNNKNEEKNKYKGNINDKEINNDEIKKEKNSIKNEQDNEVYNDYKVIVKRRRRININKHGDKNVENEYDRMIEMPSFDILEQNDNKKEEFNKLRKEYQDLILKKRNGNNNIFPINHRRKSKYIKSIFTKNFDTSKLTFDSNGKIINLNLPKLSNVSSEFSSPRQKIIDNIDPSSNKRNNRKITFKFKKPTISSFEKYTFHSNENSKIIRDKNNIILNASSQDNISNINNNISNITNINGGAEKIEYNPVDHKSIFYFNKFSASRNEKIIGGPNFEKMIPEVGVIIHNENEKNQKKFGGFKYLSKYNKISINELSKILDNNAKFHSGNNSMLSFDSGNDENNYNGYIEEFSENNNPLFQNAHRINNKDRIFSSISNTRSNNNLKHKIYSIDIGDSPNNNSKRNLKYYHSSIYSKKRLMENNMKSIKISDDKKINNFYGILINDEKDENSNISQSKNNKSKNIISIKELIDKKRKLPIIEDLNKRKKELIKGRNIINKFNSNIIKNKFWGNKINIENEPNKYENGININPKNIFRKEKSKKSEDNKNINYNKINLLSGRNVKKRIFSSSSTGALIS